MIVLGYWLLEIIASRHALKGGLKVFKVFADFGYRFFEYRQSDF